MDIKIEKPEINVAVIGGGTGTAAAWLASSSKTKDLKVWLFEAKDQIGGNVQSPVILGKHREAGAEFIGPKGDEDVPERSYRDLHTIFKLLNVETVPFPLTFSFRNVKTGQELILPPLESYYSDESFFKNKTSNAVHLEVKTLWNHVFDLLYLKEMIDEAKEIKNPELSEKGKEENKKLPIPHALLLAKQKSLDPANVLTLEEFAEHFIAKAEKPEEQAKRRAFVNDILYPLIAAGWGLHKVSDVKAFCAHYAMHYLETKSHWYDVPDGIHSYFEKMLKDIDPGQVRTNCPVETIVPVKVQGQTKYKLRLKDGTYACDEKGEIRLFNDVIIATPAYETQKLLAEIDDKETQDLVKLAGEVEYIPTTIIHHQDQSYEFNQKTAANTFYDPETGQASNTMVKYWKDEKLGEAQAVKKTWLLPGQPKPNNILHEAHFYHPLMSKSYYMCEQKMHHLQGKVPGIFYAATMAGTGDSHESALRVTLKNLVECLERHGLEIDDYPLLKHFPEIVKSVRDQRKGATTTTETTIQDKFRFLTPNIVSSPTDQEKVESHSLS